MKFSTGVKDGLPIGFGYFAVSFSFGIAGSKFLAWPLVTLISMTNLTSAGQFAGLQIMADAAGTFIEMAIATFFINLRYSLMAISLSQKVAPSFGTFKRLLLATGITDEIYALAVSQTEPVTARYFAGLMVLPYDERLGRGAVRDVCRDCRPADEGSPPDAYRGIDCHCLQSRVQVRSRLERCDGRFCDYHLRAGRIACGGGAFPA